MAEGDGLENRLAGNRHGGSNPSSSDGWGVVLTCFIRCFRYSHRIALRYSMTAGWRTPKRVLVTRLVLFLVWFAERFCCPFRSPSPQSDSAPPRQAAQARGPWNAYPFDRSCALRTGRYCAVIVASR